MSGAGDAVRVCGEALRLRRSVWVAGDSRTGSAAAVGEGTESSGSRCCDGSTRRALFVVAAGVGAAATRDGGAKLVLAKAAEGAVRLRPRVPLGRGGAAGVWLGWSMALSSSRQGGEAWRRGKVVVAERKDARQRALYAVATARLL